MTTRRVENPRSEALAAARRAIDEHPGAHAHTRWIGLRRVIELHHRNLGELTSLLKQPSEDLGLAMSLIQNVEAPTVRDQFTAQLDQKLHNAVASAVTLVDHTRAAMNSYEGTPFAAEFERRNSLIRNDDRTALIRDFRNYVLHRYGTLPLNFNLNLGQGAFRAPVRINSALIRPWPKWSAGAKRVLDASEWIDLGELFEWYRGVSVELHRWLLEAMHKLHTEERDQVNELIAQFNEILTGSRTPREHSGQRSSG